MSSAMMVRADISPAELKELRKLALEQDVTMQAMIGSLIQEYLRANGVPTSDEAAA